MTNHNALIIKYRPGHGFDIFYRVYTKKSLADLIKWLNSNNIYFFTQRKNFPVEIALTYESAYRLGNILNWTLSSQKYTARFKAFKFDWELHHYLSSKPLVID
jgi:hypothetical protein